ncbi:MAG: hypothetical protein U1E05_14625 [Patescibacteria group bacterium]|nr:hypothetical protein [Patescibacteria group bacterium]
MRVRQSCTGLSAVSAMLVPAVLVLKVLVLAMLVLTGAARAETAAEAHARGNTLLRQGDVQQSLEAFAMAVQSDRENRDYAARYMLVRRVTQLQKSLEVETNAARWEHTARALEHFYRTEQMYKEALALSQQKYDRLKDARSAAALAETQLAMSLSAEAVATLQSLDAEKATPSTQSLLAIALTHEGKTEESRQIAESVVLPKDAGPAVLYSAARMYAATGSTELAMETLRRCFESVPAGQIEAFRHHARKCTEFAALASTASFATVLQTKSKVAESKCSGGTTCAGCPMRGKCPSSK